MAVPKKKTSKIKKAKRKYGWFYNAQKKAIRSLSTSFQVLKKKLVSCPPNS
nr:ribosomal protein L32 [Dinophyceae sp. MRD-151]